MTFQKDAFPIQTRPKSSLIDGYITNTGNSGGKRLSFGELGFSKGTSREIVRVVNSVDGMIAQTLKIGKHGNHC